MTNKPMPNGEPMKYCEDCAHFWNLALSGRLEHGSCDLETRDSDNGWRVTRTQQPALQYASVRRMQGQACGPEGKQFEPRTQPLPKRPSLWRRIVNVVRNFP